MLARSQHVHEQGLSSLFCHLSRTWDHIAGWTASFRVFGVIPGIPRTHDVFMSTSRPILGTDFADALSWRV